MPNWRVWERRSAWRAAKRKCKALPSGAWRKNCTTAWSSLRDVILPAVIQPVPLRLTAAACFRLLCCENEIHPVEAYPRTLTPRSQRERLQRPGYPLGHPLPFLPTRRDVIGRQFSRDEVSLHNGEVIPTALSNITVKNSHVQRPKYRRITSTVATTAWAMALMDERRGN